MAGEEEKDSSRGRMAGEEAKDSSRGRMAGEEAKDSSRYRTAGQDSVDSHRQTAGSYTEKGLWRTDTIFMGTDRRQKKDMRRRHRKTEIRKTGRR